MKKKILKICIFILTFISIYTLVYKPFIQQVFVKIETQHLQIGSYIFSTDTRTNSNSFLNETFKFVKVVTDIDGDYVRLASVRKFENPDEQINSMDPRNHDYYNYLKSTIDTIQFTAVDVNENLIYVGDQKNILKYYPIIKKQPFYYTVGYGNKPIPLDVRGNPWSEYFDAVYSKKEIIENAKLVRYTLTNQNDGIPYLYDLGEKIELIVNKK